MKTNVLYSVSIVKEWKCENDVVWGGKSILKPFIFNRSYFIEGRERCLWWGWQKNGKRKKFDDGTKKSRKKFKNRRWHFKLFRFFFLLSISIFQSCSFLFDKELNSPSIICFYVCNSLFWNRWCWTVTRISKQIYNEKWLVSNFVEIIDFWNLQKNFPLVTLIAWLSEICPQSFKTLVFSLSPFYLVKL